MRLFAKVFLCAVLVLSAALLLSGYLLITYSYEGAIERETERALSQYQYNKFSVQSGLISYAESGAGAAYPEAGLFSDIPGELNGQSAFFDDGKELLFSNISGAVDLSMLDKADYGTVIHQVQVLDSASLLLVCGRLAQSGTSLYLLMAVDIGPVAAQKKLMVDSFGSVYFLTIVMSMLVVLTLSTFLTRPIKRMTKATARIAGGEYSERLAVSGSDEIGILSANFNLMADAVEDRINELSENARQKEDFVASFAHELKTPLTSVIGYADMLYQKALSPSETRNAAWYILSEGLRLEALSMKLMELTMLGRQEFVLEELPADELLESVAGGLAPLFQKKKVTPHLSAEPAYVRAEYDLFKTLLLNLIDNSIKAGCSDIVISGRLKEGRYAVTLTDNGRGMPPTELGRITQAFYMIDKSRSRKQHGVGLGLSLASKIAEIHGDRLRFRSAEKVGTSVELSLPLSGEAGHA